MKFTTLILIILLISFGAVLIVYTLEGKPKQTACTEEAKLCPDGSAVGRTGPDCEFEPCPVSKRCIRNSDCVVFGQDGDCNCGCYNKQALPQNSGGACFCAAPTSCECINGQCEGFFEEIEKTYCTEEQRNADVCIEIYQPVCGWANEKIQCLKWPCASTYSNSCFACIDKNVEYYTDGECPE